MSITIYTDGSAKGNPGPGGFGIVLLSNEGHRKEVFSGFAKQLIIEWSSLVLLLL